MVKLVVMKKTKALKPDRLQPLRKRKRQVKYMSTYRKPIFWATVAAGAVLACLVAGLIFGGIAVAYYSRKLPSPNTLISRDVELSTKIYDRNGELLYGVHGEKDRILVKLEDVPLYLRQATIAMEDKNFYHHRGFDVLGMVRSLRTILTGRGLVGGSTLTQQLIKNALLTTEKTLPRKIKELILALQIERRYSKDEILQMYLNETPYGGQAWGIEAAAQMYFGKTTKELSLAEATLLAGLPQAPSRYSPYSDPEAAEWRQEQVLRRMVEDGYLTQEEADAADAEELDYKPLGANIRAAHFVMYVRQLLEERYGSSLVQEGGLKVTTSLDIKMQEQAEHIVYEEVNKAAGLLVGNGALLAMDPKNGQILVMVGSKDYFDESTDGNVNVTISDRQPGSSIKPVTYVTAFKQGYTPASLVMDVQTTFPGGVGLPDYTPENYDGKFRGPLQFRYALGNSINVAAVKVLKLVGIPAMLETAHAMGITTLNEPDRYGLSLTLGGGEVKLLDMCTVFSTFATGGVRRDPVVILKVEDKDGHILEEWHETPGQRVLSQEQAYLISEVLSDNNARVEAFGEWSPLRLAGYQVAVKTGTTDDKKDNWTIGYTPGLTIGVWVGNNDNTPMHPRLASGITGAAPIWHRAMETFLPTRPKENFIRPEGIVAATVDKLSGLLPGEGTEATREEIFVKGTVPVEKDNLHQVLEVCTVDGKLATEACQRAGEVEKRSFVVLKAELPEWEEFVDKWANEVYKDDPKYHPPTEKSTQYFDNNGNPTESERPWVEIHSPGGGDSVDKDFEVEVSVWSPYDVVKVEFYVDGSLVGSPLTSLLEKPHKKTLHLADSMVGEHELMVKGYDSAGNVGESTIKINVR
jgi:1A family penicillin-binding protein